MRSLVVLAALIFAASSAVAGQPAAFCAAAKKPVDADPRLAAAVAAAFGKVMFNAAGEDCLYPLQVLRYATADVLVVQAGEPGQACHGCGAPLSAHVLRRVDDGFKIVRRYPKFATLGTFGAVGNISAVEIGGDDGMAIESGGMFQGYSFSAVDFFAFHAGQLVSLNDTPIMIDADNGGAVTDPDKTIEVTGEVVPRSRGQNGPRRRLQDQGSRRDAGRARHLAPAGNLAVLAHGRVPPEVFEIWDGG